MSASCVGGKQDLRDSLSWSCNRSMQVLHQNLFWDIRQVENVFARSFAKHLSPSLHPESHGYMWHQFSWWLVLDGTVAGGN